MKELSLREQQLILLDILKYFDGVCRKHNIKYTLCGGTLIGAIRHKGFIPWDDDIDIYITRDEYEKFRKVLSEEKHEYYYLSDSSDFESFTAAFCPRIYDKRTLLTNYVRRPQPIFLDVIVLDYIEKNEENIGILKNYKETYLKFLEYHVKHMNSSIFIHKLFYRYRARYYFNKMMKDIKYFAKNDKSKSDMLASTFYIFDGIDKAFIPAEYFNNFIEVDFEGNKFLSIKEYDEHLTFYYGDYMQLPPEKERSPKHTRKSYLL